MIAKLLNINCSSLSGRILMLSLLRYSLCLSVALSVALLCVVFQPGLRQFVLPLLAALFLCWLLWRMAGKRAWKWLGEQDFFSPQVAYPLAYVAWFTVGGIDFFYLPSSVSFGAFDPIPGRVMIYAGVGLAGYMCGTWSCPRRALNGHTESLAAYRFSWNPHLFKVAVAALSLISLVMYAYIAYHMGIPILSSNAGEDRLELENYHWAGTPFFASAYTVVFLLLGNMWTNSSGLSRRVKVASLGGIGLIFVVFLSMAGRAIIVPPLLAGIIMYHCLKKRLHAKRIVSMIVILFVLLSVYGYVRDQTVEDRMTVWLADAGVPSEVQPFLYCYLYVRYSVATLRDVSSVIPTQVPYQHGAITLLPFQSVLPGHHQMADYFYKSLLGNEFLGAGQPATVLGAFYADLGVVGIFLGMFGLGLLLTRLYRWMLADRTLFPTMVFAWVMQAALFGLFGGTFTYLDTLMIPLCWVVLNYIIQRRSKSDPATLPTPAPSPAQFA